MFNQLVQVEITTFIFIIISSKHKEYLQGLQSASCSDVTILCFFNFRIFHGKSNFKSDQLFLFL